MPADFAAIERSRLARGAFDPTAPRRDSSEKPANGPNYARTDYAVVKEFDDGRKFEIVASRLTWLEADTRAGRLRDAMTDAQCGEGWNYQARAMGGSGKRAAFVSKGQFSVAEQARRGRMGGRAAHGPKYNHPDPEVRKALGRKAAAARWGK